MLGSLICLNFKLNTINEWNGIHLETTHIVAKDSGRTSVSVTVPLCESLVRKNTSLSAPEESLQQLLPSPFGNQRLILGEVQLI